MNFTTKPVKGKYLLGTDPAEGVVVSFKLSGPMTNGAVTKSGTVSFTTDAAGLIPSGSVIECNDDNTTYPSIRTYTVTETYQSKIIREYQIRVSVANKSVELGTLSITRPPVTSASFGQVDAKGDLLVGTGNDVVTRVPAGTAGQSLVVNPGAPSGLSYLGFSVYVVEVGDDSDLAAALLTAPAAARLVAVKVAD